MPNSTNQSQQNGNNSQAAPGQHHGPAHGPGNPNQASNGARPGAAPGAKPDAKPAPPPAPPMSAADQAKVPLVTAQTPPDKKKLIGQNYTTPDMIAKVTGQAKYAEDYRADGML